MGAARAARTSRHGTLNSCAHLTHIRYSPTDRHPAAGLPHISQRCSTSTLQYPIEDHHPAISNTHKRTSSTQPKLRIDTPPATAAARLTLSALVGSRHRFFSSSSSRLASTSNLELEQQGAVEQPRALQKPRRASLAAGDVAADVLQLRVATEHRDPRSCLLLIRLVAQDAG